MKNAQKPDHASLNTIISWLKEGRFVIPDFQREFAWTATDIRELMRSIFLDYYIGSLLLWNGSDDNFKTLSCEPVWGRKKDEGKAEYIVLDGQQRLTAMHYAFCAPDVPLPRRKNRYMYFVRVDLLMSDHVEEAFEYEWTKRLLNKLMGSEELQFASHRFPLSVVGAGGFALPNWLQDYTKYWRDKVTAAEKCGDEQAAEQAEVHAQNALKFADMMQAIVEQYQISFNELHRDLPIDKVCDIFTQINSRGVQLDIFDLMNAMLKPKDIQLKGLYRDAKPRLEFAGSGRTNIYVLQVMSIRKQAYCSPRYLYYLIPGREKSLRLPDGTRKKEILVADESEFRKQWKIAVDAMEKALNRLKHPQEYGVISPDYLPYASILPVFTALDLHVSELPPQERMKAQQKLRFWYWSSVFTNRYSGQTESLSRRDYLDVTAWINGEKDEPDPILQFRRDFRTLPLRKERKPSSSIYRGIFNLLVISGARDWISGNIVQNNELDNHHIVPRSWGKKNLRGNMVDMILNRTPLTSETNRHVIGSKLPNKYIPEMIEANGEAEVRKILESHLISAEAQAILLRDPFTPVDFQDFVDERHRTILQAIEDLIVKQRIGLPPQLKELDEAIEQVELTLRQLIAVTLDNKPDEIPHNLLEKTKERLERTAKKDATFNPDDYQALLAMLQFADLRELQQMLQCKALWEKFVDRFKNKNTLTSKFDQLAELRNSIRHSRSVTDIVRKEGEAAILWFQDVLKGVGDG
ncbi:MAG: DUF262 domain-containing protein [Planctomycetota bacterium]|nr:MAG: DUF262 domain-containing protein [Planctomycetota bacterium]REK20428.1 MAG: DUF262 domain-containing protein [Planctomycetota bacterium]REK29279.1 MAG: DUF262 domain-containing protein [Planctomycetota bacterium]